MYREIYLDNSATTRPYDEVTELMGSIQRNVYGNPSSLHSKGIEAERKISAAREAVAKSLGTEAKQIFFTSGGTEANNFAIRGCLDANPRKGKHIITTKIEHPSVLEVFKHLESTGYKADYLDVGRDGRIRLEELREKITKETALISIISVNNETGAIQPVMEAVQVKNSINPQAVFHTDAVQAYGKIPLNPSKSGIDLMTVSSHKIHGPKGVGALYASKAVRLKPILFGGGQEALLRSGTENVPGICGFGLAAEMTLKNLEANAQKTSHLKKAFIEKLSACDFRYAVISPDESSPFIVNISFEGLKAEVLLHHLEERGIYVSTGSACSSRKNIRSHVLQAMGLAASSIDSAIRFSFSGFNTPADIDETVQALQDIVPRIQINKKRPEGSRR